MYCLENHSHIIIGAADFESFKIEYYFCIIIIIKNIFIQGSTIRLKFCFSM